MAMALVARALEQEVATIRGLLAEQSEASELPGPKRIEIDRSFARIMALIAPRIRHFTRQYGLTDMREDAQQACAIAVHRAIEAFDPAKSRFTTFVSWQLRGELQGLRFRMRTDQRGSARRVQATTVSLDALHGEMGVSLAEMLVDEEAQERTESLASEAMTRSTCHALLDDYFGQMFQLGARRIEREAVHGRKRRPGPVKSGPGAIHRLEASLERERAILLEHLLGEEDENDDGSLNAEQKRQVCRRITRNLAQRVSEAA
jgi:RNA polymerase sigma-32 factor